MHIHFRQSLCTRFQRCPPSSLLCNFWQIHRICLKILIVNLHAHFKLKHQLTLWLYVHSQYKVVSNLSGIDLTSVLSDNLHDASWWRSSVGDGSSGGQHGHVEAKSHVLFPSCVHALDVIGLRLVRNQLGMFLNDKHEACFSL